MSEEQQLPPGPTSYAPSSEPFYSNIPAAPISSRNYPQAPRVRNDSYGTRDPSDPYSDMGYALLPEAEDLPAPGDHTQSHPTQSHSTQSHPTSAADPSAVYGDLRNPAFTSGEPPSIEDLYRAPGNPYADRSGRAISPVPAQSASTLRTSSSNRPRGLTQPGGHQPSTSDPAAAPSTGPATTTGTRKPKRRVGCLALVIAVIAIGSLLFQAVVKVATHFTTERDPASSTAPALTSVADTDLEEGMCFDKLEYVSSNHLQPIPCDEPHRFEVAENVSAPWGAYPGEDEVAEFASGQCRTIATDLTSRFDTRPLTPHSLYPSEGTWRNGDRTITCFISVAGSQRLNGSAHEGDLEVH